MAYKSLLTMLLMLLTLAFGDAKGGGRSGGRIRGYYHSSSGGSHHYYSGGQDGGEGMYNHSSYYSHDGGSGGGRSSEEPLSVLIIYNVTLATCAFLVLFVVLFLGWHAVLDLLSVLKKKYDHEESSQDTKTTPLYNRTSTKDHRVDEEYDSEIARYCAEEFVIPKDVKLPSSGAWNGTYTEKGVTHSSSYDLTFDETGNNISGSTYDQDGYANIRGRFYYNTNGRINAIWLEDYGGGLKTLCRGAILVNHHGSSIVGTYKASTGVAGPFECSPFGP